MDGRSRLHKRADGLVEFGIVRARGALSVRYEWRLQSRWNRLAAHAKDEPREMADGSAEQFIANLGDGSNCAGHWIKVSARADGSFTVTNSRNGFTKIYKPTS